MRRIFRKVFLSANLEEWWRLTAGEQGTEASWLGCRTVVWLTVPNDSRCRCNVKPEGQRSLPVWNLECGSGLQERRFQQGTSGLGKSGLNEVPSSHNLRMCFSALCKLCPTSNVSTSLNLVSQVPCSAHPSPQVSGEAVAFASNLEGARWGWQAERRAMDSSCILSPIIVRIGTKSCAVIILPEAPVHAHLYMTCMDPNFVSTELLNRAGHWRLRWLERCTNLWHFLQIRQF